MVRRRLDDERSAVARSLAMLTAFDAEHRSMTLSALAVRCDLPLTTAHRIAAELSEAGLLRRRDDGSYEVGERAWDLGALTMTGTLRVLALPILQELVRSCGLAVILALRREYEATIVDYLIPGHLPSPHRARAALPLHASAVGKVLLAFDNVKQAPTTEGLTRYTRFTITDSAALTRQLDVVRLTGLAHSDQEHRVGLTAVAVPVLGPERVEAALGVEGPTRGGRVSQSICQLRAAAVAIASAMNRDGSPATSTGYGYRLEAAQ